MKKILSLAAFCIFIFALSAQTGLFDLEYGMTYEECYDELSAKGFEDIDAYDELVEFVNWDNEYVDVIVTVFDPLSDTLVGWYVVYMPQAEEDIEEIVIEAIESHNGEVYDYDADSGIRTWDLGGDLGVEAYWDEAGDYYWVIYFDRSKLDLFTY